MTIAHFRLTWHPVRSRKAIRGVSSERTDAYVPADHVSGEERSNTDSRQSINNQ
jgi:hypothetical protein